MARIAGRMAIGGMVAMCHALASMAAPSSPAPHGSAAVAPTRAWATVQEDVFDLVDLGGGVWATVVAPPTNPSSFANSLIIVNDDHVVVVDSRGGVEAAERLIETIRGVAGDRPVRYLVNTHWHGDHVHGNATFRAAYPDLRIIGHSTTGPDSLELGAGRVAEDIDRLSGAIAERRGWLGDGERPDGTAFTEEEREQLEAQLARADERVAQLRALELVPPDVAIDDTLVLRDGGREIHVLHLGAAHTRGDLLVWLPDVGLLAVGDLVEQGFPYLGDGFPSGWAHALERIRAMPFERLFPAHGAVLDGRELIEAQGEFLRTLVAEVQRRRDEGATLEQGVATIDLSPFEVVFTGGDPERRDAFGEFVRGAIEAAWREQR